MQLSANTAWFTATLNGRTDFQVYSFSGQEAVSQPYAFTLELVHSRHDEPLTDFIGAPVVLSIVDRTGTPRLVHGLVNEMIRLHRGNHLTHYQCSIVPRFWFLDKNRDHRIFQNKSVQQIVTQILQEQGFASETFAFKCFTTYPQREYCVQYGESDLHFISRLCEEEGIYYYFEHSIDGHCLCFSDMAGGPLIPGLSLLRYAPGSGQTADTSVVSRVSLHAQAVSDKATYRDWSFLTPPVMLEASTNEPDFAKAPVAPGIDYDTYRSPYLHQTIAEGERYARLQLLRQLTNQTWIEAQSDASRFTPGFTFSLYGHDNPAINATWWITSVMHNGIQPQVLGREAPDSGMSYATHLECIPEMTRFVPELMHPKYRITGDQTALVTGPAGEEIYPDEHGRVKVQFFWDREGKQDENTTCWIRASQGWAGTQYGNMAVPRIGHEVIVSFLEGDPDRPLITGRLYHAENMPPYALPVNKTRTVFKSVSSPAGKDARGFNEFRIEDKSKQEEIYVHSENDVNVYVKNDWKETIVRDQRRTTDNNTYVRTEGETHETLQKQRKTEIYANDNQTVHADSHTKVDDKWLTKVGSEVHLYAGEKAVFEAGTEATLKGGGSWIKFDPAGVFMDGPAITLGGGGSAGERKAAGPELPVGSQGSVSSEAPSTSKKAEPELPVGSQGSVSSEPPSISQDKMALHGTLYALAENIATDAGGSPEKTTSLVVMINTNMFGHAGFKVGEGDSAILYDPAGSYTGCYDRACKDKNGDPIVRGSDDFFLGEPDGFAWADYLAYHRADCADCGEVDDINDVIDATGVGEIIDATPIIDYINFTPINNVTEYAFEIPQSQADTIASLIKYKYGAKPPSECAATVSSLLKESQGIFSELPISTFPSRLGNDLRKISGVKITRW